MIITMVGMTKMPTYLFNESKKYYRRRSPKAYGEHFAIAAAVLLAVALVIYLVSKAAI